MIRSVRRKTTKMHRNSQLFRVSAPTLRLMGSIFYLRPVYALKRPRFPDEIKSGCGQENSNIDGKLVILKAYASSKCQFLWFLASFYFSKTEYRPKKTSGAFRAEVKNRTHQVEICQMRILNAEKNVKS